MKRAMTRTAAVCLSILLLAACGTAAPEAQVTAGEAAESAVSAAAAETPAVSQAGKTPDASGLPVGSAPGKTVPLITKDKIQADAAQLVSVIESMHPAFVLNDVPEGYEDAKKAFLSEASGDMTKDDFTWLVRAYLASLKCGHTAISMQNDVEAFLDIAWQEDGGRLFLCDDDGRLTNRYVTEINGIPIEQVFETVGRYFTAENAAATALNNTTWTRSKKALSKAGVDCEGNQVTLTIRAGSATVKSDVGFVLKNPYFYYDSVPVIDNWLIDDVFYIDFNACRPGPEVDETVSDLKKAMESGVSKVIIDVRKNGGGNSAACVQLLEAMGMEVPRYGAYIRCSPLASARYEDIKPSGHYEQAPNAGAAKQNPDIKLVILTDYSTYSSATMLAVLTQDGKLGKIIGQPSANSPSAYGDILYFDLDNSGLTITVSFKRFTRPDTKADQRMLQPDILVPLSEDALKSALEYLNSI